MAVPCIASMTAQVRVVRLPDGAALVATAAAIWATVHAKPSRVVRWLRHGLPMDVAQPRGLCRGNGPSWIVQTSALKSPCPEEPLASH